MASYIVMESSQGRSADGTVESVYIRDGFSLAAFVVPPFWLFWHRLWIEGAVALAAVFCLRAFGAAVGLGAGAAVALWLLGSLYVALEGPALRVRALRRRGWKEWGIVRASTRSDAEDEHLLLTLPEEGSEAPSQPLRWSAGSANGRRPTGPVMGLLDYPGGR